MHQDDTAELPRRTAVAGLGLAALAGVAGCAQYGGPDSPPPKDDDDGGEKPKTTDGAGGGALASTADVPVGGGAVFKEQEVVVTQPSKGEFKGFSAICTHQGCVVDNVGSGTINCKCHGSKFKIADGAVAAGPAGRPLAAKPIKVDGDQIILG